MTPRPVAGLPCPPPFTYARQKMEPCTGGLLVRVQVTPPSSEVAASALSFEARSPPPTIPFHGFRNATEIAPALGELTNGVSYAFQVSPLSRVAKMRSICPASGNPSVFAALSGDTGAACCKRGFARQRGWHQVGNR